MPGTVLDGVAERLPAAVREALLAPLVDHHCHGVRRDDLDRDAFEIAMTEAGTPAPPGATHFDTRSDWRSGGGARPSSACPRTRRPTTTSPAGRSWAPPRPTAGC